MVVPGSMPNMMRSLPKIYSFCLVKIGNKMKLSIKKGRLKNDLSLMNTLVVIV